MRKCFRDALAGISTGGRGRGRKRFSHKRMLRQKSRLDVRLSFSELYIRTYCTYALRPRSAYDALELHRCVPSPSDASPHTDVPNSRPAPARTPTALRRPPGPPTSAHAHAPRARHFLEREHAPRAGRLPAQHAGRRAACPARLDEGPAGVGTGGRGEGRRDHRDEAAPAGGGRGRCAVPRAAVGLRQ